jgi:RNase P subunit RPR2
MKLTITCEACGTRHRLEREILWPQDIRMVCHGCEEPLVVRAELVAAVGRRHPARVAA